MFAKRFFYASAGLFLLALAFHLGARNATAQAPGNPVVSVNHVANIDFLAATASGDVYYTTNAGASWVLRGNVFGGGPIPVRHESIGSVKARYR